MAFAEFAPYFSDVDAVFCGVATYPADERYENSQDKIGVQFIVGMVDSKPKVKDRRLKLSPSQIYEGGGGPNLVIKFSKEEYQQANWAKVFKAAVAGSRWSLEIGMSAMSLGSGAAMSLFTLLSADNIG